MTACTLSIGSYTLSIEPLGCLNDKKDDYFIFATLPDLHHLAIHNSDYNIRVGFIFMQDQTQDWTADEFADLSKGPDSLGTSNHTVCWIT